jgi:2-amino-4-hydroxy-6-hydroxymethyldihydropteridine diphosphokinase
MKKDPTVISHPHIQRLAAIALGSNLGDRTAHLQHAIARLRLFLRDLKHSRLIETEPVGVEDGQPAYLNGAAIGDTALGPRELLDQLLLIERERGRSRPFKGAARTLDLDLIMLGDLIVDEPGLRLPHPRFRDRLFVLEPLAEVAPAAVDPVSGLPVGELLVRARRRAAPPGRKEGHQARPSSLDRTVGCE